MNVLNHLRGALCVMLAWGTVVSAAAPPTISSFAPASGPVGTQVTIVGQDFDGVTAVEFGGAPANFVIGATGTNIFASVPGNAVTGPITVKAPTGTNQSSSVFTVTVSPPPSITDFSPTLGPVGSSVTISGSNLSFITNVLFNGQPAAFNHGFFGTTVIATVPAGATTGPITVASSGGSSTSTTSFTVTVSPPPVITGFSPVRGRPGQSVTVNGENLNTATAVSYNGTPAVFDVFGPVLLTVVPAGATTGPISVTTPGGTAVSSAAFEVIDPRFPLISGFSPAGGDPGTVVAITGDNFNNVAAVRFHDNRAASFNRISAQRIDAVVPAGTITGPISVTTDIGTETTSTNFFAAAQIASFTPASGPVGTAVTITGSNFSHLLDVTFGAIRAAFSNVSPTQIIATVPAEAVTGPISLVTPATTTVSSGPFTVLPTITGFSPQAGLPGTVVRLEGSGFAGVTQVRLNGLAAAFSNSAPDELLVTIPANATTGPFTITTPSISVSSSTSFFVGRATDTGVQVTQVPERLNPGDRLTYTITVTNRGPGTATNVVVTTTLPPTVDQIFIFSNSGNCSDTNRVVTCVFASLAAGASTTIKVNALVTSTNQPLRNVVQVRSAEFEADSSDNEVEFTVPTGAAPPPPPSIAGFSPASARPGELVNITGSNLQTASSVTFGGAAALFNVSGSALTAVVPSNAVTGPIRVTTAGGTAVSANNFIFIDPRQPVITGFTPQEGRPGTTVRITGGSFTNITEVRFANLVLAAFTILSNEQLDAISPTGAVTGPITLVTLFGNATTTSNFVVLPPVTPPPAPVIASFAPSSGRPGESVTISGQNLSNATAVAFGGAAASFTVTGAGILATVPANGVTGPITVTNPGGTATSATVFTVIDPRVPIISGFSPQQGSPGTSVSITGASFTNVTGVRFHDGVVAAFTVLSNEQLNALAPTGAVTGPITLLTPFGSATTTNNFVVLPPPPAISSFSPERGRPGESVTISGQNFSNATQVTFGGAPASFSVTGAVIVATVPSNAVTGAIGVTTPSGTAASTNVFTVIDSRVPVISGFSPQEGPPGTRVSITGAHFTNITGVRFHDGVVAAFAVESNEQLNAISPTGAVTGPITLVTPFGNATTSSNFVALPPPPAPVIASFTPQSGRPGESVTISGQNFSNATAVTFGGAAASFSVTGAVIVATVPSNAVTGPIGVTGPGGTAASTNVFTVIDPRVPIISGFSPQQGPPGTLVSITGANFTNVTEVRFHDGAVAAFTLVSNEQLDTRSPTGAVTGPITLVTPFGNATTTSNFVAQPAPVDVSLTIARVDRTHVSISWPAAPAEQQGLRLESTDSLGPAAVWVPSTNAPTVVDGQARVIETSDVGNRFYRLHRP